MAYLRKRSKGYSVYIKIVAAFLFILLAIALIMIRLFGAENNRSVNIADFIQVSFSGLNGRGKAVCSIDTDKLYKQLAMDEKNTEVLSKIKAVINSISINADSSNLSNGDRVTVKVTYDKSTAQKVDCHLRNTKYTVKTDGLAEGKTVDIFENIQVIIAGISPEAYANVVNNWSEEELKNITFTISNPTNISKGDTITVTCNATEEQMAERGYILQSYSKDYKIDKVSSYVSEISQMDIELLKTIKGEAVQTIKSETESMDFRMFYKATGDKSYLFQDNSEHVNSSELLKAVFLSKKENIQTTVNNYVYLFFKANISNQSTTSDIYFVFEYTDGILNNENQFILEHSGEDSRYLCGMSYEDLYGRTVQSKDASYGVTEISTLH